MKKIALILIGLIMMSTAAFAYNTVVTLTITNVDNQWYNTSTLEFEKNNGIADCSCSGTSFTGIVSISVGNTYSFICSAESGDAHSITISGVACKKQKGDPGECDPWSDPGVNLNLVFPFVID